MPAIKIKGVKAVYSPATDRTYYYNRDPWRRIEAPFGTPEFLAEIQRIRGTAPAPDINPGPHRAFEDLIAAYKASEDFTDLKPATRLSYDRAFDFLKPVGARAIAEWSDDFILAIRDKAYTQSGRWLANYVLSVVSLLMNWGKTRKWTTGNPAELVDKKKKPRNAERANRPWTNAERAIVLAEASDELRIVIAIGMYAATRQADALKFPRANFNGKEVFWRASKNGADQWLPAHPTLVTILRQAPKEGTIFALNSRGQPWTNSGFRASFYKLIRRLKDEGKVAAGLTFHGLRHTLGDALAEAGASKRQIADVLGITEQMAGHYSRGAEKKHNVTAAFGLLKRGKNEFWKKPVARLEKKVSKRALPTS